ncbi:hypothetical protein GUJ93_ZPchr0007g6039 [Zizania palustris]|uniref:Uncharacterized protein n=1 Tax=Zizania palustris TaxID=103762 RepID=A0A8J5VR15_ZIZPA|nr:hypothetical protein GUJ93_ZPchr0007g6039 [Zizania palustris]
MEENAAWLRLRELRMELGLATKLLPASASPTARRLDNPDTAVPAPPRGELGVEYMTGEWSLQAAESSRNEEGGECAEDGERFVGGHGGDGRANVPGRSERAAAALRRVVVVVGGLGLGLEGGDGSEAAER